MEVIDFVNKLKGFTRDYQMGYLTGELATRLDRIEQLLVDILTEMKEGKERKPGEGGYGPKS